MKYSQHFFWMATSAIIVTVLLSSPKIFALDNQSNSCQEACETKKDQGERDCTKERKETEDTCLETAETDILDILYLYQNHNIPCQGAQGAALLVCIDNLCHPQNTDHPEFSEVCWTFNSILDNYWKCLGRAENDYNDCMTLERGRFWACMRDC